MALRDYLNFESTADFANFTLQNGQAVAILTMDGITPLETWYFNASSMAVPNGTTVFKPNAIDISEPGRYIKNMTASDWNTTINKPIFADVALSGDYNDLDNKLTAGEGILMDSNEISVDSTKFMSIADANQAISDMENEIASKAPQIRTITINGITQDLEANRDWEVGNISNTGSYSNPSWITAIAASKVTGLSSVATSGSYLDLSNKPTLFDGNYNSLSNKPTLFSGAYNDLTGKPTLFSGSYVDLTNKPTIPTNTNQLTNGSGFITALSTDTFTNKSGNISQWTNNSGYLTSVPAQSWTSITGKPTTLSGYGITDAYPLTGNPSGFLTSASITPSYNNTAVKTINGAGVQISTTKNTRVSYTITHTIALTLVLSSGSSMVYLEISPNNSTWTSISQAGFSDAVAIAVALNKTSTNNVQGEVPAGFYVRLRAVTSGAGSAAYTVGQEVQY